MASDHVPHEFYVYYFGVSVSFHALPRHNHIDHIYMAFLQCVSVSVLLVYHFYKIVCRNIHTHMAEYPSVFFDVSTNSA